MGMIFRGGKKILRAAKLKQHGQHDQVKSNIRFSRCRLMSRCRRGSLPPMAHS